MSGSQRCICALECIRCGIFLFIILGGIAGLVTLIVSLVRDGRPHDPRFSLISLTLTGLNVSTSSQQVGGNWDALFIIKSRHFKIAYQDVGSSISYNGELLSRTSILSFNQRAHNLTRMEVHYSAIDAPAGQRDAIVSLATVTALIADLTRGSVGFDVRVIVGKAITSGITSVDEEIQVLCGVVPINVSEDGASGNFNGGPRKCKVQAHDLPTRFRQ